LVFRECALERADRVAGALYQSRGCGRAADIDPQELCSVRPRPGSMTRPLDREGILDVIVTYAARRQGFEVSGNACQ
jgi:hypothetical protein